MNQYQRLICFIILVSLDQVRSLGAQVQLPKPPEKFDVEFRYRIQAGRNHRIILFDGMMKYLTKIHFVEKETEGSDLAAFNPDADRMLGVIPSQDSRLLLLEDHIQTILLTPTGWTPPAEKKQRVKVLLEISSGLSLSRQKLFAEQIKNVLTAFEFQDAFGYDHRSYTLIRGSIPWMHVRTLLRDLRGQPSGWFLPNVHEDDLPEPLNLMLPIRLIEVQPENNPPPVVVGQAPLPFIPPDQPHLGKLTSELRRYLLEDGKKDAPVRVEILLTYTPTKEDDLWRTAIADMGGALIEGRLGKVVTAMVPSGDRLLRMAQLEGVDSIRLPRLAIIPTPPVTDPPGKEEPKAELDPLFLQRVQAQDSINILKDSRLAQLHSRGKRGAGTRIAIIDTDFSGYEQSAQGAGCIDRHPLIPAQSIHDDVRAMKLDQVPLQFKEAVCALSMQ